jgi:hypothetical protein
MDEKNIAIIKLGDIVKELEKLGVVRTTDLEGEIGTYYAKKKLYENKKIELELMRINNKNYDAKDKEGKTYEIKTRRSPDFKTARTQFTNVGHKEFDFLVTVNLDFDFSLLLIYLIPKRLTLELTNKNKRGNVVIPKSWLDTNQELIVYINKTKLEDRKFET